MSQRFTYLLSSPLFQLFRESIKSVLTQIKCLERFTAFQSKKTILETVTKMGMVNFFVTGHSDHRDSTLDDIKLADLQEELGEAHLDELGLFNIAGIETLTTAFSAVIFLLSMHPEVQAKVYDELISIIGEDFHKKPSLSELENLKYLDMVIKESLRLYPPAYVAPRRATEDIHIGEFTIPKGKVFQFTSFTIDILNSTLHNFYRYSRFLDS
ncbi:probable cytochrome P450 4d21 [Diaphorina citri]|uniref:Probable cytochrome P450 4d21 n=1 Tax=Diaphorina citri TaxID=121845 RepID=A0A3Q0JC33_DIACI|nr:probable cytochrome P450 4d21 [Diaphorina citri]